MKQADARHSYRPPQGLPTSRRRRRWAQFCFVAVLATAPLALSACWARPIGADHRTDSSVRLKLEGATDDQPASDDRWSVVWFEYAKASVNFPPAGQTAAGVTRIPDPPLRVPPHLARTTYSVEPHGLSPSTNYHYRVCGNIEGDPPVCNGNTAFSTQAQFAGSIRSVKGYPSGYCRPGGPGETYIVCDQGTDETVIPWSGDPARHSPGSSNASIKALPGGSGYLVEGQTFRLPEGHPHSVPCDEDMPAGPKCTRPYTIALVSTDPNDPHYPADPNDPRGRIYRIAGNGSNNSADCTRIPHSCEDGINALDATVLWAQDAAALPNGGVLIAENFGRKIRYVAPPNPTTGVRVITTLAGNGGACNLTANSPSLPLDEPACPGEGGPATEVSLPPLTSVEPYSYDPATGKFGYYFHGGQQIWKVDPQGILTRVAGDGRPAAADGSFFSGDDPLSLTGDDPVTINLPSAPHPYPAALGGGFIFFEGGSCRFRHVDSNGMMRTVAGRGTHHKPGGDCWKYHHDDGPLGSGDGGNARDARLISGFFDVTSDGGIIFTEFVTQPNAGQVRYITPPDANGNRAISTVAGYGVIGHNQGSDYDIGWPATYAKTGISTTVSLFTWNGMKGFLFNDNGRIRFVDVNLTPFQPTVSGP